MTVPLAGIAALDDDSASPPRIGEGIEQPGEIVARAHRAHDAASANIEIATASTMLDCPDQR